MIIPGALILILALIGSVSTGILVGSARQSPRIGALTERAALGVFLSMFGMLYGLAAINSDLGFAVLDQHVVQAVIRSLVVVIGLIPAYWLWLYWTGRLGGGDE